MQILFNGLISGATIGVLALGFAVVYLPARVFHIALAGIYAGAPFVAWACRQAGAPWWLSIAAAATTGVVVSLICEALNHRPLCRKSASDGLHLISSLGIYIILVQVIAIIWGNEAKTLRTGIDPTFGFANVILTRSQILAGTVSVVLLAAFYGWLRLSNLGLQFRALADNPIQLALFGYNTDRLRLLAFGVSGFLAAASSLLTGYDIGFDPHTGLHALLLAVVAVIIGGRDSFLGPALAGVLLDVIRSQVVWHFSARWQDAVTFVVLVLFLFLRPHGLLGQKMRLEAQA